MNTTLSHIRLLCVLCIKKPHKVCANIVQSTLSSSVKINHIVTQQCMYRKYESNDFSGNILNRTIVTALLNSAIQKRCSGTFLNWSRNGLPNVIERAECIVIYGLYVL